MSKLPSEERADLAEARERRNRHTFSLAFSLGMVLGGAAFVTGLFLGRHWKAEMCAVSNASFTWLGVSVLVSSILGLLAARSLSKPVMHRARRERDVGLMLAVESTDPRLVEHGMGWTGDDEIEALFERGLLVNQTDITGERDSVMSERGRRYAMEVLGTNW